MGCPAHHEKLGQPQFEKQTSNLPETQAPAEAGFAVISRLESLLVAPGCSKLRSKNHLFYERKTWDPFLHHNVNRVVLNNLHSIKRHNLEAIIATISAGEVLPNGYAMDATPDVKKLHSATPSRGSDWLVCSWFLQRKEKCDKWWIVEWDTFCRM